MKAIRKIDGKQIEVEPVYNMGELTEYFRGEGGVYSPSDLDFLPEKETAVIEGWVARDKKGAIFAYHNKPSKSDCDETWSDGIGYFELRKISGKANDFSRWMKAPQCFF